MDQIALVQIDHLQRMLIDLISLAEGCGSDVGVTHYKSTLKIIHSVNSYIEMAKRGEVSWEYVEPLLKVARIKYDTLNREYLDQRNIFLSRTTAKRISDQTDLKVRD